MLCTEEIQEIFLYNIIKLNRFFFLFAIVLFYPSTLCVKNIGLLGNLAEVSLSGSHALLGENKEFVPQPLKKNIKWCNDETKDTFSREW